jgi:hypothetical protein
VGLLQKQRELKNYIKEECILVVQSARLYKVDIDMSIVDLYKRLEDVHLTEERKINDEIYKLSTLVRGVSWKKEGESLAGALLYETLEVIPQIDDTVTYVPKVNRVDFVFTLGSLYFIPFGNQYESEKAASEINRSLFGREPHILNCFLSPTQVEEFLRRNPYTLKICNWLGLRIPGVDKARLGGADVERSEDYRRYERLGGEKSFIIVTLHENRWTIGLSWKGSILFFTPITRDDMLNFIERKILPLF